MRITKEIASEVALKMVQKRIRKNEKTLETLKEKILDRILNSKVPQEILTFSNKGFQNWLKHSSGVRLIGNGFNHEYIDLKKFPSSCGNSYINLEPNPEDAKEWKDLFDKYQSEKDQIRNLRNELEILLYNLKTYPKVEKEFPEAFIYLPEKKETGLAICVEDIRKKLIG